MSIWVPWLQSNRNLRQEVRLVAEQRDLIDDEAGVYLDALLRIAASKRPDGTYNLSREACEQLARDALTKARERMRGETA